MYMYMDTNKNNNNNNNNNKNNNNNNNKNDHVGDTVIENISLTQLKYGFDNIIDLKTSLDLSCSDIISKIDYVTNTYSDFIKQTIDNSDLANFGFDTLYFQGKLLKTEYENLQKYYNIILNRIYGEYYKLYKMILKYIISMNIDTSETLQTSSNLYPIYDDIDKLKQYDMNIVCLIHVNIIQLLTIINTFLQKKDVKATEVNDQIKYGLNLTNVVNTISYTNHLYNNKLKLFVSYVEFFQERHLYYLHKFKNKLALFENQLIDEK